MKPDRTVRNIQGHTFASAMHDLFEVWYKRMSFDLENGITFQEQCRFWWMIDMSLQGVQFFAAAPEGEASAYMLHRLERYYPNATIEEMPYKPVSKEHTEVVEMNLERNNIFSLSYKSSEDTTPISDMLSVLQDFREDDRVLIACCFEPFDRVSWSDVATKAHREWSDGKTPGRTTLKGTIQPLKALEWANNLLYEAHEIVMGIDENSEEAKKKDRERNRKPVKVSDINHVDRNMDATHSKKTQAPFKVWLRIYITCKDKERRSVLKRSFANVYTSLAGDNRFVASKARPSTIEEVNNLKLHPSTILHFNQNILSAGEVGKLIQLPTAQLQDEYAEYLDFVEHREVQLSPSVFDTDGLYMGRTTYKGVTKDVYFPVKDHDELCLPRIVIGGMGQGKTQGTGANFAVECVKKGYSVFAIDTAKGELGDQVEGWCNQNGYQKSVKRIRFGQKPFGLDWCEINNSQRAANQFSQEVLAFFDRQGADPGLETKRYIRLAAKTVASVGGSRLSDIVKLFTDKEHLALQMRKLHEAGRSDLVEDWIPFVKLTDGMRGKVLEPVLNRLDILLGDDYIRSCMESKNSVDMRKWIDAGYAVILDVPKNELGEEATDVLCALLVAKIWLATLNRKEHNANPAFFIMDEPHVYMSSAKHWRSMVVESRKWRLGLMWMFHAWEQIPRDLAEIIKAAGPHYSLYQPSKRTFQSLAEESTPFTLEEALKIPRHYAINIWRTGGKIETPFLVQMPKPPLQN